MMLKFERQTLAEPERMPGLRSSFLSLESHMGRLTSIDFDDVFGKDKMTTGPNPFDLYMQQFN